MFKGFSPFSFGYPINPDPWRYGLSAGPRGGPKPGPRPGPRAYRRPFRKTGKRVGGRLRRWGKRTMARRKTFKSFRRNRRNGASRGTFRQRVLNTLSTTTGRKLGQTVNSERISTTGTPGVTKYWGTDVGLGGSSITWTNGGRTIPAGGDGDLLYIPKLSDNTLVAGSTSRMTVKHSTSTLVLRNQANFGCFLKVYYCKTPIDNAIPAQDTCNEILNGMIPTLQSIDDTQESDLTDYPDFSTKFQIVTRRNYTLMPGETRKFKINTFIKGFHAINKINFRTRNEYTRSIIFQLTGFPLHESTNQDIIASSPVSVDMISTWRGRGFSINSATNQTTRTHLGFAMPNPAGEQWQQGNAGVVYAD